MKIRKAALLAAIVLCFLSGCGKKEKDTVVSRQKDKLTLSLSWWGSDSRHEYTMEGVKDFEERNPNVRVRLKYGTWDGFKQRMDTEIASHTEADIMQINYAWLHEYSPDGEGFYNLRDLTAYVSLSNFDEALLELGTINGKLNAVPIAMNTPIFYWNKTLYDQYGLDIPSDWDDLFAAAQVMSKDGVYPLGAAQRFTWFLCTAYVEQQTGRRILGEGTALEFTEEDVQSMIEFYVRLVEEKVIPQTELFDRLMFADGQCAGALAWISDANVFCDEPAENGYDILVGDYVASDQAKRLGWYMKPACMYAISKETTHTKEAGLLLNYLLNSEKMSLMQQMEKGVPISNAARNTLQKNDLLKGLQYDGYTKMNENMDDLELVSVYYEDDLLVNAFQAAASQVLQHRQTPERAAKELYAGLQASLEKLAQ